MCVMMIIISAQKHFELQCNIEKIAMKYRDHYTNNNTNKKQCAGKYCKQNDRTRDKSGGMEVCNDYNSV